VSLIFVNADFSASYNPTSSPRPFLNSTAFLPGQPLPLAQFLACDVWDEIVNAEMQRDSQLVRFKVFAISKPFAFKSLQFLPDGQECSLDMARPERF
jgi:hypothetical protein